MERVVKVMVMKAMVTKAFNVQKKDDGDDGDDNDDEEGEKNGESEGDGDEDEDKIMAVLTLAWRHWSVRPIIRDDEGDKDNGNEGNADGNEGL